MRSHAKASPAGSSMRPGRRGGRAIVLCLAVALLALLVIVASASASKEILTSFGSASGAGGLGGEFNEPSDVAVNTTGNGPANAHDTYVVDSANNRVERFDGSGNFISAWGADVVQEGGSGDVGNAAAKAFEICTVAAQCKAGVASGGNGAANGDGALSNPQSVAVDSDTGNVYVSDRANQRIDEYQGDGTFIVSFGFDTDETTAGTGYEVCPAADACKAGVAGSGIGQVGAPSGIFGHSLGLAVSPADGNAATGTLFFADSANRRVNTYGLDGTSPASFGSASVFGAAQPRAIAVDSRGVVYASNSNAEAEIERYDSQGVDGPVGFLAPIVPPGNEVQHIHFSGFEFTSPREQFSLTCPNGDPAQPTFYTPGLFATNAAGALNQSCSEGHFTGVEEGPGDAVITVEGGLGGTDVPQIGCTPVALPSASCPVTTVADGHPGPLRTPYNVPISTAGLALDPSSNTLYVLRQGRVPSQIIPGGFEPKTVIEQFGPSHDPGLAAAPTEVDAIHGEGSDFGFAQGFGLDETSGKLFVSTTDAHPGIGPGHRVYVLNDLSSVPTPVTTIGAVTEIDETTATFSGTVDPQGALVSCRFQYSTDKVSWTDVDKTDCSSVALDGGAQPVSQKVTGLDPNTHYYVRLAASRPLFAGSTVVSAGLSAFDTKAVPPVVSDLGAVDVNDKSVRLVATIDPRHSDTGYVFQYGTTPALGSSTEPLGIGEGTTPITVSQPLNGLAPGTTYYFRVVATNQIGTTTAPGRTVRTRSTPLPLPEGRHWEQVTPPDKNYGDADGGFGLVRFGVSLDGNAVDFCPSVLFGEPANRMAATCSPYISRRGEGGWQTPNTLPDYCHVDPYSGDSDGVIGVFPSPDFSRLLILKPESADCPIPKLDPAAPTIAGGLAYNLYLEEPSTNPLSYQLLNPAAGTGFGSQLYVGGDEDFSHLVYQSEVNQTPFPSDSPAPGNFLKLYEWDDGAGALRLVSRDTGNEPFTTSSQIPSIGYPNGAQFASAVSSDGERIFFSNPTTESPPECTGPGCELYMREAGAVTYDVSESECTSACGSPQAKGDMFLSATPSGEEAFFTSCAKLTDESPAPACSNGSPWNTFFGGTEGSKLYRWERGAPAGHRLVDLTADHEPSDGTQSDFLGLIGQSDDGDTAYFVTRGQIVAGEPTTPVTTGIEQDFNLIFKNAKIYRWQWNGGDPKVDYLGPYQSLVSPHWRAEMNWMQQHRQVSDDGSYLMIYTRLRLDPAADHDSDVDVYRWGEASGWLCPSCQAPGVASRGDVDLEDVKNEYTGASFFPETGSFQQQVTMSDDGQHIFFGTPDALVPQDVNGEAGCPLDAGFFAATHVNLYSCEDVYEWHDGTVSLISGGTSDEPSRLTGASRSGRDVFFFTSQRLVGWDLDDNVDIYDARVGGGFPEPPPQPPQCEGNELCRGTGTNPASGVGAGTAVFEGPGNPTSKHPKTHKRHKSRKHHKKNHRAGRAAKHNRRAGR